MLVYFSYMFSVYSSFLPSYQDSVVYYFFKCQFKTCTLKYRLFFIIKGFRTIVFIFIVISTTLNEKNPQASSQKFRQLISFILLATVYFLFISSSNCTSCCHFSRCNERIDLKHYFTIKTRLQFFSI